MTNIELARIIIELVGGKENISKATNCMTRLRLTLKDTSNVDDNAIKATEGVLGLVVEGDSYQIVLGPGKVKKVADICFNELSLPSAGNAGVSDDWKENKDKIKDGQKQSAFKNAIRIISEIFIPMLPAIISAGLFNGLGGLISTLQKQGTLPTGGFVSGVQLIFSLLGFAFLGYFAIYTGVNSAKQFGATEALGGMIGAASIAPAIIDIATLLNSIPVINLANGKVVIDIVFYNADAPLKSVLTTGKGGIIGVIIGVWILSRVEKAIRKIIPDILDLILTPFLSLLITGTLFVFIIMPLAGVFSDGLVAALSVIINSPNPVVSVISGYLLSALFLPMVLLGLHHGLIPIYAVQLETMGGVSLFPVLAMSGAGQVGAAIAIYFIAKRVGNKRIQKVITGALPAGFLGVGEPLIYGVTLPMFKPFITAGIGAGFGGAYVMVTKVMSTAWGPSGLVAIPTMQTTSMLNYFIGLVICYVAGFIITFLTIKDKDVIDA